MRQIHSTMRRQPHGDNRPPIVSELEAIFATLPDGDLLNLLRGPRRWGRPSYRPEILWRCYVTYYALGVESISALIRLLRNNPYIAEVCGIPHPSLMPSQPTFSRFGTKLAKPQYQVAVRNVQRALTRRFYSLLPDFGQSVAIDSTHMKGWSNGKRRGRSRKSSIRRQRPKPGKVSDSDAGWIVKRNSEGNKQYWWGYKAHIICDSRYEIPMAVEVTRGNFSDLRKAAPLLQQVRYSYRQDPKIVLADAGYSSEALRHRIRKYYEAAPIIDPHPTHKKAAARMERLNPDWRELYKGRSSIERVNSRLKAFYKLDAVRVRGRSKVRVHAFLAVIALEARALAFPAQLCCCVGSGY